MKPEKRYRVVTATGRRGRPEIQTGMLTWRDACAKLADLGPGHRLVEVRAVRCACGEWTLPGLVCSRCSARARMVRFWERRRAAA